MKSIMRYDIRSHQQLRRLLLLGGLVLLSALVAGGLLGRSPRNAVAGASAQELGKLNRFIQSSNAKDEAMKAFRQGRDQIEDENWNGAAATFISFVTDYPKHKDVDAALYWTAFALKKQGKFAEADAVLSVGRRQEGAQAPSECALHHVQQPPSPAPSTPPRQGTGDRTGGWTARGWALPRAVRSEE